MFKEYFEEAVSLLVEAVLGQPISVAAQHTQGTCNSLCSDVPVTPPVALVVGGISEGIRGISAHGVITNVVVKPLVTAVSIVRTHKTANPQFWKFKGLEKG